MIQPPQYCSLPSLRARQCKRGDGDAWHMSSPRFHSVCCSALTDPWIYTQCTFLVIYCNRTTFMDFCLYFNQKWSKEWKKKSTSNSKFSSREVKINFWLHEHRTKIENSSWLIMFMLWIDLPEGGMQIKDSIWFLVEAFMTRIQTMI